MHLPLADGDDTEEVARVAVLLTSEVGLLVSELIQLCLEVDVCGVDLDMSVELSTRVPCAGEVAWQITGRLNQLGAVHRYSKHQTLTHSLSCLAPLSHTVMSSKEEK